MDKKSARNRINGAQKDGLVIHKNKDYDEFFQTYRSFIQKKHIKSLFDIFGVGSTTLESMKKNGTLFVAKYGDELLNGTLYLEDDSHIEAWISATKRFDITSNKKKLFGGSDRLVDWEAIKYAKEKGLKEFDLGGIWPEEEAAKDIIKQGINDFKKNYGGKVVTRYSYQKYYSKTFKLISNLYSLRYLGR
jgi:lipid II:glycine glycyltransferase (peptidoglycan interpeptide bridge formation enzyme)